MLAPTYSNPGTQGTPAGYGIGGYSSPLKPWQRGISMAGLGARQMAGMASGDPFWYQRMQAERAPEAYSLAAQMLAPGGEYGAQMGGDKRWLPGIDQAVMALTRRAQSPHPGMPAPAYEEATRGIQAESGRQLGELGGQMASFGGSLDPEAFMHASRGVKAGAQRARGGLEAQRSLMDTQALLQAINALSPYYQEQQAGTRRRQQEIAGLAGNIMASGTYSLPGIRGTIGRGGRQPQYGQQRTSMNPYG